jgi:hypothetical protein
MTLKRPLIVWFGIIALGFAVVFQVITLILGLLLPHWRVQPLQAALMIPSLFALLSLLLPRRWSHLAGASGIGILWILFLISAITTSLDNTPPPPHGLIWLFVALWTWLFFAFSLSLSSKRYFSMIVQTHKTK